MINYRSRFLAEKGGYKTHRDKISEKEIEIIKKDYEFVQRLLLFADYYLMTIYNFNDFIIDCKDNSVNKPENFIRCNRLLINSLNMFYVWKNYLLKKCRRTSITTLVKKRIKKGYLGLADILRNVGVHNSVLVFSISSQMRDNSFSIHYNIDLKRSMTDNQINGIYKDVKKLLNNDLNVDAIHFSENFLAEFIQLHMDLWKEIETEYLEIVSRLCSYFPNDENVFNAEIVCDENDDKLLVGVLMDRVSEKNLLINNLTARFLLHE